MCVIFGAHVDERSPAYRAMDRYFWIGHLVANRLLWLRRLILWLASHGRRHGRAPVHVDQEDGGPCCDAITDSACSAYLGAAWSPRGLAAARKRLRGSQQQPDRTRADFLIAAIPDEIRLNGALSLAE